MKRNTIVKSEISFNQTQLYIFEVFFYQVLARWWPFSAKHVVVKITKNKVVPRFLILANYTKTQRDFNFKKEN